MGKVKDWVIEMEEDASYMTRQQFMDKHGETVVEYYDELQLKWQIDYADPGDEAVVAAENAAICRAMKND